MEALSVACLKADKYAHYGFPWFIVIGNNTKVNSCNQQMVFPQRVFNVLQILMLNRT